MAGSHEIPQDDAEPSTAQRLARRVIDRVTTRLHERYTEYRDGDRCSTRHVGRIVARLQTRFQCRRNQPEACEEKPPLRKPHRWLVILSAINRSWQFLCAVAFYASYTVLLFDSNRVTNVASQAIERLSYGAIFCIALISLCRRSSSHLVGRFSFMAIILDGLMISLASCQLVTLKSSEALASCLPKETAPYVRSMLKNGQAYAYTRWGWGKATEPETIDLQCCLPKIVVALTYTVIFSYAVSVFLSGLVLLRGREAPVSDSLPGYIEEAIPASLVQHRPSTPRASVASSRPSMSQRPSMAEEEPKYTNLEDIPFPRPRLSQETTSSFNPDSYLVSDGFRPIVQQLPGYSRPPSYRSHRTGPPSYSSRPSSLHNEV